MKREIIICGTEIVSEAFFVRICRSYSPVCFIEPKAVAAKRTAHGLPVLTLTEALSSYPNRQILMMVSHYEKHATIDHLLQSGVPVDQIVGLGDVIEKRWGCAYLGEYVAFWKEGLRHCCSLADTYHLPVQSRYHYSGAETYQAFTSDTHTLIEHIQDAGLRKKYCGSCHLLRYGQWVAGKRIDKVNIGIESRCNYKCTYCGEGGGPYGGAELDDGSSIDAALEMLDHCQKNDLLDEFAYFFISCGEPALHPRIGDISALLQDYRCTFATNAAIFSEPIATVLENGMSRLRVSIDAGVPETYAKVRGVPATFYEGVHDNLKRYTGYGRNCVELQYIIMPGINTDRKNIDGFCQFAKGICDSVLISRDRDHIVKIDADTAVALARMRKKLGETGIKMRIFDEAVRAFSADERILIDQAEAACPWDK